METLRTAELSTFAKKMGVVLRASSKEQAIISRDEFYLRKYRHVIEYTPDEVDDVIANGTIAQKRKLSRDFFERNGFYKRIILYYASLLTY